ncbi:twin-arginine translocation signal domain-containing protein [Mesorhizobium sp. B2-4-5]|uniref:twin-arginine translocation signal domain-containing protein n=1 Tax=Mesorhizobium sp. B2-4-5 TaxID=2589944 RepID=UPI00112D511F|nr:twin-arginine translocation signal domain-containing protein [Mesorhizobium sp. B2-4-5]TPL42659.1 twin-arginine translocation signal domain-containing protein [Mesorhizobium sp. B2-4-5]
MERRSFLKALGLAAVLPAAASVAKPAAKPLVSRAADDTSVKTVLLRDLQIGTIHAGVLHAPGMDINLTKGHLEFFG